MPTGFRAARRRTRLLSRLIGLETEYATLIRHREGGATDEGMLPDRQSVFESIQREIQKSQPTAPSQSDDSQCFLASGGAICAETDADAWSEPGGLIEGATPEVRSPRELLNCQRALDRTITEAAGRCDLEFDVTLLKNNCDAAGNIYGCQENYQCNVATGVLLWVYRAMVLMLLPAYALYLFSSAVLLITAGAVLGAYRAIPILLQGRMVTGVELFRPIRKSSLRFFITCIHVTQAPMALVMKAIVYTSAFVPQRRHLAALFVSRLAVCGSGHVDQKGRFWLSAKACGINAMIGFARQPFDCRNPIINLGHWWDAVCHRPSVALPAIFGLLR
ncbi:MAG: proteasome accessory factor PafA2 family protein, partial [Planctomycetota bacterium]